MGICILHCLLELMKLHGLEVFVAFFSWLQLVFKFQSLFFFNLFNSKPIPPLLDYLIPNYISLLHNPTNGLNSSVFLIFFGNWKYSWHSRKSLTLFSLNSNFLTTHNYPQSIHSKFKGYCEFSPHFIRLVIVCRVKWKWSTQHLTKSKFHFISNSNSNATQHTFWKYCCNPCEPSLVNMWRKNHINIFLSAWPSKSKIGETTNEEERA